MEVKALMHIVQWCRWVVIPGGLDTALNMGYVVQVIRILIADWLATCHILGNGPISELLGPDFLHRSVLGTRYSVGERELYFGTREKLMENMHFGPPLPTAPNHSATPLLLFTSCAVGGGHA